MRAEVCVAGLGTRSLAKAGDSPDGRQIGIVVKWSSGRVTWWRMVRGAGLGHDHARKHGTIPTGVEWPSVPIGFVSFVSSWLLRSFQELTWFLTGAKPGHRINAGERCS